jgi:hypothetical protein
VTDPRDRWPVQRDESVRRDGRSGAFPPGPGTYSTAGSRPRGEAMLAGPSGVTGWRNLGDGRSLAFWTLRDESRSHEAA